MFNLLGLLPSARSAAAVSLSHEEWRVVTDEAIRFRLAFQLTETGQGTIPADCMERLNESVRATLMRNMKQLMHLREMVGACDAAGVNTILLKGLWLTQCVYRNLKARSSSDIDLLIRRDDLPRFTHVVRSLGFDVPGAKPPANEVTLTHPEQKSRFDLHWSLEAPLDEDAFWRRSIVVDIAGTPCRTLSVEDHLIYLCLHAALQHYFQYVGPRALLDIGKLIASPPAPIDWDAVIERTRSMKCERAVWLVFDLVREHVGIEPPVPVMEALRPVDNAAEIRSAATDAIFLDIRPYESLPWSLASILNEPSLPRRSLALWRRTSDPRRWWSLIERHLPKLVSLVSGNRKRAAELKRTRLIRAWLSAPQSAR